MRVLNVEGIRARDKRKMVFSGAEAFDDAVRGHGMAGEPGRLLKQAVRDQIGDGAKITAHDLRQVISNLGDEHRVSGSSDVDRAFSGATQIYMCYTNDADVFRALPEAQEMNVQDVISRAVENNL